MTRLFAQWAAGMALGWLAVAPALAELDTGELAAIEKAKTSLRWLENFSCPALGAPMSVRGMGSEAETAAQMETSWSFAQNALEGLRGPLSRRQTVLRSAKPGDNYDAELARMDEQFQVAVARASTALVNWSLANWVDLSRLEGRLDYPLVGPHPLQPYARRLGELNQLTGMAAKLPGNEYLTPIGGKFRQCLLALQSQFVQRNAGSIRGAVAAATQPAQLDAILQAYGPIDPQFSSGAVPQPIQEVRDQVALLEDRQRRAAEAEAARQAKAQPGGATRDAKAGRAGGPPAASAPDLSAELKVAGAVVKALDNQAAGEALKYMHAEVVLSSPLGQARGKLEVSSALQKGFTSGRSGSIGQPYVSGSQVVADVQSQRGSGRMLFGFKDGLVSSIQFR